MFYREIKEYSEILDSEIESFAQSVLSVDWLANDVIKKLNMQKELVYLGRKDLADQINQSYVDQGFNPFRGINVPLELIENYKNYDFLNLVYPDYVASDVIVRLTIGENLVLPHVDVGNRQQILNFPILNAYSSRTNFYKFTNGKPDRNTFFYSELEQVDALVMKPKTLYAFNGAEPHGIQVSNAEPRIILSYGISDKPQYLSKYYYFFQ